MTATECSGGGTHALLSRSDQKRDLTPDFPTDWTWTKLPVLESSGSGEEDSYLRLAARTRNRSLSCFFHAQMTMRSKL